MCREYMVKKSLILYQTHMSYVCGGGASLVKLATSMYSWHHLVHVLCSKISTKVKRRHIWRVKVGRYIWVTDLG
jgi:hypothetical protein